MADFLFCNNYGNLKPLKVSAGSMSPSTSIFMVATVLVDSVNSDSLDKSLILSVISVWNLEAPLLSHKFLIVPVTKNR